MKKSKRTLLNILILLMAGSLLSSLNYSINNITAFSSTNLQMNQPVLHALVTHGPIVIEYDENFTDYGFPGAGTPGDPYRIENYNITVTSEYPILFGGSTSKYFVIQDCFLKTDTNIGIYLGKYDYMADGTVKILNNIIITDNVGIEMNGGRGAYISGNTITSNDNGMSIYDSSGFSTISDNIISTVNSAGINVEGSSNITITRNTCVGNNLGISLSNMADAIVTHNNCSENNIGIEITYTSNNTITNNILINNSDNGIFTSSDDDSVFSNNLFQENINYAIEFSLGSDNNNVHHNAFIDNNGGGVQASDNGANNIWFDTISLEGNFWNDWISGSYDIDGSASSVDPYPLGTIPEIPEFSNINILIFLLSSIFVIPVVKLFRRKK